MRLTLLPLAVLTALLPALSGCGGSSSPVPAPPVSAPAPVPAPAPANNPAPAVASLTPVSVTAGAAAQTITVTGSGFIASSVVSLDGTALPTTYVSATSLQAALPASALAAGQTANVTVANPAPGGGTSPTAPFPIMSPTPVVAGLQPSSVPQGAAVTITVNGTGFEANSGALWNGSPRLTTFVSGTSLQVALSAADVASFGSGQITVNNPGPGGSTTTPANLTVIATPPVIGSVSPSSILVSQTKAPVTVTVSGTNFTVNATLKANGMLVPITAQSGTQITGTLASSFFAATGSIQIVVTNPPSSTGASGVSSSPALIAVINPTASFSIQPNFAPAGSPDTKVTLYGQGFFPDSVVQWNGTPLQTTYNNSGSLSATLTASLLAGLGVDTVTVSTPENGKQQPPPQSFSTYLPLAVNDIVWNSKDSLIYATIPGAAGEGLGNSVVSIDPNTGVIQKAIFVGSEPDRLVISGDGTTAFVGLNGAGAVRQVDLQTGMAGVQFNLGGGPGVYNAPYTAQSLAAVPGQPASVAVYSSNGVVSVYDAGVARAKNSTGLQTYFTNNYGGLTFGDSAGTLYVSSEAIGSYVYKLSVDATGVTASKQLTSSGGGRTLQYDKGRLYFPVGVVADASSGATLGQFSAVQSFSSTPSAVAGPIFSDSTLNLAWILASNFGSNTIALSSFDETTFNPVSSLAVTGVGENNSYPAGNVADLIRWGQTGLAFHTGSQLYILQGPIVKDTSSAPADLQVTAQVPGTATTGTALNYQFQVTNHGPNAAAGVTLLATLPGSVIFGSVTASQGTCTGSGELYCDLGPLANGATANITLAGTPTVAGATQATATVSSQTFDPAEANNQVSAATTVSGAVFSSTPLLTQLSPNLVASGSKTLSLTVNGNGFTNASTVLWNGVALPTAFVDSGQLTATVDASLLASIGWAQVSVSSAPPGGGQSGSLTFNIYGLLDVPANAVAYDAFTRKLYAALPSTSSTLTGNSLVAINPTNGSLGTPVLVGSEPNLLSETSDGKYLFIGLSGAKSLGRFNLLTQTIDLTVPLVETQFFSSGPAAAVSLATVPGSDTTLAVEVSSFGGIGIFDIMGSSGSFRSKYGFGYAGDNPVFTDANHFYAYDAATSGAEFYRYTVDSSGVSEIDGTTLLGMGGFGGRLAFDRGLVYGSGGGIVDPSTTPPSQVAVLPLGLGLYNSGLYGGGVVPYGAEQKSFNIGVNAAGQALTFLERFDTVHFLLEDRLQLPSPSNIGAVAGTRWGQDGLAYVLSSGFGSTAPSQILLLRGPFVLPAEASVHTAPTLSAVGTGTIAAGSGNQYLSVTGTGFLPGASVLWSGVVHDTTYIDAQHLNVAVGAAEVQSATTVNLTCQNPGSAASNALAIVVQ